MEESLYQINEDNTDYLKSLGFDINILLKYQFEESLIKEIKETFKESPSSGIFLITGEFHLNKTTHALVNILNNSIDAFSILLIDALDIKNSLDDFIDFKNLRLSYHLVLVLNIDPKIIDNQLLARLVSGVTRSFLPLVLTTPYDLEEFESNCNPTLKSLILPYLVKEF